MKPKSPLPIFQSMLMRLMVLLFPYIPISLHSYQTYGENELYQKDYKYIMTSTYIPVACVQAVLIIVLNGVIELTTI